jgi:hypothetical protein
MDEEESFVQFAERLTEAYAADIGRVAIAWNSIHAMLATIFAPIVSSH